MDYTPGDVGYVKKNLGHYIQNTSDTESQVLGVLRAPRLIAAARSPRGRSFPLTPEVATRLKAITFEAALVVHHSKSGGQCLDRAVAKPRVAFPTMPMDAATRKESDNCLTRIVR
jgi:hypothetical protein